MSREPQEEWSELPHSITAFSSFTPERAEDALGDSLVRLGMQTSNNLACKSMPK
jgi:hypothetical protein